MTNSTQWLKQFGIVVWRHTSAGVALVLIALAIVVGYRIGHTQEEPSASSDGEYVQSHDEQQMYTCEMHPSVRL